MESLPVKLRKTNAALYYFGVANLIAFILCLILMGFTSLEYQGIHALIKPSKFFISGGIFVLTMLFLVRFLPPSKGITAYCWVLIIVFSYENIYILIKALQQEGSHFNISTPLSGILFSLMGVMISMAMVLTAVIGFRFIFTKTPQLKPYLKLSIILGIFICVIFSFEGGLMAAKLSHSVGIEDGEAGLPYLNWSSIAGDLRVAHFFGLHALQILPLLSYFFLKKSWQVAMLAVLYASFCTFLLLQALNQESFISI